MPPVQVHIKHAGKVHDLALDTSLPGLAFKESIYQVTGVPVDRMKVMIKGGMLKVCYVDICAGFTCCCNFRLLVLIPFGSPLLS